MKSQTDSPSEFQRFDAALTKALSVSHAEVQHVNLGIQVRGL